jgi:hypothetical protein
MLHVWGVSRWSVPGALRRMVTARRPLRATPGLRFHKLLGTGSGRTFTALDADPGHWALLTVWDDASAAAVTPSHPALTTWDDVARERLVVRMTPLVSRGRWSGREPFGDPVPRKVPGPVASITRARLAARRAPTFWRAVPPVSDDLRQVTGLRLAVGIGEAPIGLQGTFSLWDDARSLTDFAHRRPAHLAAIRRTPAERWYVEELFARFEVLDVCGTFDGAHP